MIQFCLCWGLEPMKDLIHTSHTSGCSCTDSEQNTEPLEFPVLLNTQARRNQPVLRESIKTLHMTSKHSSPKHSTIQVEIRMAQTELFSLGLQVLQLSAPRRWDSTSTYSSRKDFTKQGPESPINASLAPNLMRGSKLSVQRENLSVVGIKSSEDLPHAQWSCN